MIKTVNVRALKDRLSAHLREVGQGHVLLVTDRGQVVAEIRKPTLHVLALDEMAEREQRLVEQGTLRPGLPNSPAAYASGPERGLSPDLVDAALAWTRDER